MLLIRSSFAMSIPCYRKEWVIKLLKLNKYYDLMQESIYKIKTPYRAEAAFIIRWWVIRHAFWSSIADQRRSHAPFGATDDVFKLMYSYSINYINPSNPQTYLPRFWFGGSARLPARQGVCQLSAKSFHISSRSRNRCGNDRSIFM